MAFASISKASLPVSTFGRGRESKPTVSIGDNGQIRFSTQVTADIVGKATKAVIQFDPETRVMRITPVMAPPKGMTEEDLFGLSRGKDGESKQAYFGASSLLSSDAAGIKYDYKASGTQNFDPTLGKTKQGNQFIELTIPEGALTPRPKAVRKTTTAAAPAAAAAPAPAKATAVADDADLL